MPGREMREIIEDSVHPLYLDAEAKETILLGDIIDYLLS
jgi:hypothetical protein